MLCRLHINYAFKNFVREKGIFEISRLLVKNIFIYFKPPFFVCHLVLSYYYVNIFVIYLYSQQWKKENSKFTCKLGNSIVIKTWEYSNSNSIRTEINLDCGRFQYFTAKFSLDVDMSNSVTNLPTADNNKSVFVCALLFVIYLLSELN